MADPDSLECLRLYRHWRAGRMPEPGGVLDQPAGLVAAFELMAAAEAALEAARLDEEDAARRAALRPGVVGDDPE